MVGIMEIKFRKLSVIILIVLLSVSIICISAAHASNFIDTHKVYTETTTFNPPKISRYLDNYDQIEMDDCGTITVSGHPSLPFKVISLKFDLTDAIKNVTVKVSTYDLNGTYIVSPAPKASHNKTGDHLTEPDPMIYNNSNPYPGKFYDYYIKEGIDPNTMIRVKFLIVHLYPVQYLPIDGKLTICKQADISILYESEEQVDSLKAVPSVQTYDLLIITSPNLETHVLPLLDYKNSIGISTFIKNTDEIYSTQSGRDAPEKIRNYIIYAVENFGITSVLIFGDADQVPVRYAYIPDGYLEDGDLVETDLYYADLQYSWDDNDDELWGDLENDQIDGIPDLLIGRLPVSTEFYAAAIINKTINYERYNRPNDTWFNRILLLGTDGHEYPGAEGEILKDHISDTFVWNNFTVKKLYNSQNDLSKSNVQTQINDGFGFVNFAGHGWYSAWCLADYWDLVPEFYCSVDVSDLRNGLKLPIVFTMACLTSQFADYDCIGEYFMANPNGGAIAYFGATRVSWAYSGDDITTGLAGEMDWRFNKAFFDGNWISGAVWGQAITEYVQSNPIHTNYDGYYLDWKTVAEYSSPFMDPTLMIGGRTHAGLSIDSVMTTDYVERDWGKYGDTMVVIGSGITAGTDLDFGWDGLNAWDGEKGILNSTSGNPDGSFEVWFKVPEALVGEHYLWVRDNDMGETAMWNKTFAVRSCTYSISGTVFFSTTPLDNILLELTRDGEYIPISNTTTTNGTYSFSNVTLGTYWITAYGPTPEYVPSMDYTVEVIDQNITRNIYLPKLLNLLNPENDSNVTTSRPTFSWEAFPNASRYSISVHELSNWTWSVWEDSQFTNYTLQTELSDGKEYDWNIYAKDANDHVIGAAFPPWSFKVNTSVCVTVSTDKSSYLPDELVTISGVADADAWVAVDVKNPMDSTIYTDNVQADDAGDYETMFRLPVDAMTGTYTVYANIAGATDSTTFTVVLPGLPTEISGEETLDSTGAPKTSFALGETVLVSADVSNVGTESQSMLIVVQLKDPDYRVLAPCYISMTLLPGQSLGPGLGFVLPLTGYTAGTWTAKVMVLDAWPAHGGVSIGSPVTIEFTVSG